MKKLLLFAAAVGLLIIALSPQLESIENKADRRVKTLARPAKEIVVGVCWPFAINQDGMADGIRLAQEEINSRDLAGGYTIRLVMRDDDFDWQKAKKIALEFADMRNMSAVIGYYDDSVAIKASPIFETSQLLHLIIGANNTAMTSHGFQYLVRTTLTSEKIAQSLARLTLASGHRKIALIWEEDAYGEDLAYQYGVGLDNFDVQMTYRWSYSRTRGNADFRLPVNELKGIDADIIFFAGLEPLAGDFLRKAHEAGLKTPIIGAFSDTPEMREHAGPGLEGSMFFEMYDVNSPSPENKLFVRNFRARYGRDPDTWAAQGYDALYILAKAVKFTNSRNPLDLSYAIRYMDAWEGANGRYKFDSTGELEDKPIYLEQYQRGKPVMIKKCEPLSKPVINSSMR